MLASLNHPNIAAIYGLEESGVTDFLVMELVGGEALAKQSRSQEAERLLHHARPTFDGKLRRDHWSIAYTEALLGSCSGTQRHSEEAEPLLLKGYNMSREKLGERREETSYIATRLVKFYKAQGKPQKAFEFKAGMPLQ
jgi:hypothetical protein